jgi:hypothetical protein
VRSLDAVHGRLAGVLHLQQPFKVRLAHRQGEGPQVVAGESEDVEGVELHLVIVLAGMQRVEVGLAVNA